MFKAFSRYNKRLHSLSECLVAIQKGLGSGARYRTASKKAETEEQSFVGGRDNAKIASSPIVDEGDHLLDNWSDNGDQITVTQKQIRSLLKVLGPLLNIPLLNHL